MSKKTRRPDPGVFDLPLCGVDTHAHLDMIPFESELEDILKRSRSAGVFRIGNVFLGPAAYGRNHHLFDAHPEVFFLLGIHPHDASSLGSGDIAAMEAAFKGDSRLRALGEIGLDFYYDHSPRATQQAALQEQLVLARERDLPVVIHSRDADDHVMAILTDMGFKDRAVLWHCFGGGFALAEKILELGWTISIPGTVTFRKNAVLQDAVSGLPLDGRGFEPDCPFRAPEPYRGKQNDPALAAFTAAAVAKIKNLSPQGVGSRCGRNALMFFGLGNQEESSP